MRASFSTFQDRRRQCLLNAFHQSSSTVNTWQTYVSGEIIEADHHDEDHNCHCELGGHLVRPAKENICLLPLISNDGNKNKEEQLIQFSCFFLLLVLRHDSPVVLETGHVITVKDVLPTVDVDDAGGRGDEQHQREFDHVTDLNQHGGGHQRQHGDVAVIFGVVQATFEA